jgi:hypothetical protein
MRRRTAVPILIPDQQKTVRKKRMSRRCFSPLQTKDHCAQASLTVKMPARCLHNSHYSVVKGRAFTPNAAVLPVRREPKMGFLLPHRFRAANAPRMRQHESIRYPVPFVKARFSKVWKITSFAAYTRQLSDFPGAAVPQSDRNASNPVSATDIFTGHP